MTFKGSYVQNLPFFKCSDLHYNPDLRSYGQFLSLFVFFPDKFDLKVTKGHLKISKSSFFTIYFLFNAQSFLNFSRMSRL